VGARHFVINGLRSGAWTVTIDVSRSTDLRQIRILQKGLGEPNRLPEMAGLAC
jgi:hypothetical protein